MSELDVHIQKIVMEFPNIISRLSFESRLFAYKVAPDPREVLEQKLRKAILLIERRYLQILENNNGFVSPNFWQDYERDLRSQIASPLRQQLEQSFSNYSDYVDFIDKAGAIGDIDTAMSKAIDEVAHGVSENSRLQLESLIRQGVKPDEVVERMALRFSSGHAEQISVTELTRANAHFSDALSARLGEQGVDTQIRWQTSEDEKVCPICGPADHKLRNDAISTPKGGWNGQTWGDRFGRPPAHPNCRCDTIVEITTRKPSG